MNKSVRCGSVASAMVVALLAGCGGGGGGSDPTSTAVAASAPAANFVPGTSAEQAYFSDSYEFIGDRDERGYIHNATSSTGDLDRAAYTIASGAYAPVTGLFVGQVGYLDSNEQGLDILMQFTHGSIRNDSSGSFLLKFAGRDWFSINSIREVDVSGQPFGAYLSATALGGVSGVFPAGSKAYTAEFVSKQDIYLASGIGSVFKRTASAHYFLDYYNTPSNAYCLSGTRGLVFDSLTHATSYPLIERDGTTCIVDATVAGISHDVSSHQAGNSWFFDFTNNQIQEVDFASAFFGASGTSTQIFALIVNEGTAGTVAERGNAFVYPAGSRGAYLASSGIRLNKTAINAVLEASSLPAVP